MFRVHAVKPSADALHKVCVIDEVIAINLTVVPDQSLHCREGEGGWEGGTHIVVPNKYLCIYFRELSTVDAGI